MLEPRHFKQTMSPNPSHVSLVGAWEADYWTHELGVSHGELMKIIGKVGSSLTAVRKELGLAAHEKSGNFTKQVGPI